ncbi:MAG: biotin--[acetyl-CoA-carboxylase] ligase [Promethearchaeota archaeon]
MRKPPIPIEPQTDPFQHAFSNIARSILKRLLHFEVLPSTNTYLKTLGDMGEPEGLVVLADTQSVGLGRQDRSWHSPLGGLYFSILLRPKNLAATETPLITLSTGVAIAKVIHDAFGCKTSLKWPNDVEINGRKVAGILVEQSLMNEETEYIVVGVGINANTSLIEFPHNLQKMATTLREELDRVIELPRLFSYILGQFEFWYLRFLDKGFPAITPHWRKLCSHMEKPVIITIGKERITGTTKDIDYDGCLIIQTPTGRQKIRVGDVTQLKYE